MMTTDNSFNFQQALKMNNQQSKDLSPQKKKVFFTLCYQMHINQYGSADQVESNKLLSKRFIFFI